MKEYYYDKLLHVKTGANKYTKYPDELHHHPYEPTLYGALDALFADYELKKGSQFVDFGCGKGRLNFYIHYFHNVRVKGVEMDEGLLAEALVNLQHYLHHAKKYEEAIEFICCLAEEYQIDPADTHFYFFNPFSIDIFRKVIHNILRSAEKTEREIALILYYPQDDYIRFLDKDTSFELQKEVIVPGLFEQNPYERFLIYG